MIVICAVHTEQDSDLAQPSGLLACLFASHSISDHVQVLRCATVFNMTDIFGFLRHFDGLGLCCSLTLFGIFLLVALLLRPCTCVSFSPPHEDRDHDLKLLLSSRDAASCVLTPLHVYVHILTDAIGAHGFLSL